MSNAPKLALRTKYGVKVTLYVCGKCFTEVQRAEILLRYPRGETVSAIAAALWSNRPRIERCLRKALELGVREALQDLR
jgi:hypothetical protein